MDKRIKTKLGLDLGTSSIGWWLYEIDDDEQIIRTVKAGVRIFSNGRNPKSFSSLNEDRRAARSARRCRDRYLQRRTTLLNLLIKHGLMPEDEAERKKLVVEDPYKLRSEAATNSLSPFLVGRALFHINQRRGFKSNRITDRSRGSDDGPVLASVKHFKQKLNGQTVGQYLWQHRSEGKPVRARREGTKQEDLYDHYPDREMLQEEFERIWECQQKGSHSKLYTQEAHDELNGLIFSQRKLKDPIVGKCLFFLEEDRINKSSPLFQKFRILQEVNNISYRDDAGGEQVLQGKVREQVLKKLYSTRKVRFDKIKHLLQKNTLTSDPKINLESFSRVYLDGDLTRAALTKTKNIDAEIYDSWDLDKQEKLISLLEDSDKQDAVVTEELTSLWELTKTQAENVIQANLPTDRGNLSRKAINALLPFLEEGKHFNEAVREAGLGSHSDRKGEDTNKVSLLPNYNRVLKKYCLPRKIEDVDDHHLWRIPNPTVHVALNQLRNVVNDLLRRYGRPEKIVVEIGRELPQGKKTKEEIQKKQNINRKANDKRVAKLEELGQKINYRNIELLRIWEEQGKDCADRKCVYTGKQISVNALFSGEVDVDHILPFSKTFDNSIANKVVCYAKSNRDKGNNTPFEAFSGNRDEWQQILQRSRQLPENKAWRFDETALEKWQKKNDFFDRQLPEMQFLSKAALEYLKPVSETGEVIPIPGRFTAMMRRMWGLNRLLGLSYKNRSDHRHHAIDAAVIGTVSRSLLNKLTNSAKHYEIDISQHRLFHGKTPEPYDDFRQKTKTCARKIIVSHKNERSSHGQLHDETAMGILDKKVDGYVYVSMRKPIAYFTTLKRIDSILSNRLRDELLNLYRDCESKKDFSRILKDYFTESGVKSIKISEKFLERSLVFIKDRNNHAYKAYKLNGNFCYEIYSKPDGKWDGEIIPTFYAGNSSYSPSWKKIDGAQFVMRIFRKDTFIKVTENGKKRFFVVQKISKGQITMHEHQEANVDSRNRDKEDSFSFITRSPNVLRKEGYKKVHISASGIIKTSK